jgi:hypothetical protein
MNIVLPALSLPHPPGDQYLVDVGKLIPVTAVNARSAFHMVRPGCVGLWQKLVSAKIPKVYKLASDGELIAVFD